MNFLASMISGQVDDRVHFLMTRYGRGTFDGPAAEASVSGKKLKITGSYLYVPILGQLVASVSTGDLALRGTVVSKTDVSDELEEKALEIMDVKKRGGFKYTVSGDLSPTELHSLYEDLWEAGVLTKVKGGGLSLTPGSSVPKPNKINDPSFCKLSMPSTEAEKVEAFRALVPGAEPSTFESLAVSHTIRIDEILLPEQMVGKSPSALRVAAKRKGVLTRNLVIDGEATETDFGFLV